MSEETIDSTVADFLNRSSPLLLWRALRQLQNGSKSFVDENLWPAAKAMLKQMRKDHSLTEPQSTVELGQLHGKIKRELSARSNTVIQTNNSSVEDPLVDTLMHAADTIDEILSPPGQRQVETGASSEPPHSSCSSCSDESEVIDPNQERRALKATRRAGRLPR